MEFRCVKASVRASAAQWAADMLLSFGDGDLVPCSLFVLPGAATLMAPAGPAAERLFAHAAAALGPPGGEPQTVKGGACGGEEEDGEFPFAGAMTSVTWGFPPAAQETFLGRLASLFAPCPGPGA